MNVGRYLRGEDRHVGTARTTQFQQPQRTWVGLTLDEQGDLYSEYSENPALLYRAIEAKLRSKNESKN
jgi:hypothetical protein